MALKNKETLKNYFKKGGVVGEKHFVDLIDSSMNIIDDGISINPKDGLRINPTGIFSTLISFFKKKSQKNPDFTINTNLNDLEGLSLNNGNQKTLIKIKSDSKIGINTDKPKFELDVNGTLGIRSRVGTFSIGSALADGNWHKILEKLDGISAFEVIAYASGSVNSGYYSISHVIALSTFGGSKSRSKIKNYQNSNWNGFFGNIFNKKIIKFRWSGSLHNYNLEIKTSGNWNINPETNQHYKINYSITNLMNESDERT